MPLLPSVEQGFKEGGGSTHHLTKGGRAGQVFALLGTANAHYLPDPPLLLALYGIDFPTYKQVTSPLQSPPNTDCVFCKPGVSELWEGASPWMPGLL